MYCFITIALIVTNFHVIQDTSFLALNRASHILLYANYIIKWCRTYPSNDYVLFFFSVTFFFFPFFRFLFSIPISLYIFRVSSTCNAVCFYLNFATSILQLAGANSALALAMTVISNLLGILIVSLESLVIYQSSQFKICFALFCNFFFFSE